MSGRKPGAGRWWVLLPLLGASGWLALFGDKRPSADIAAAQPTRPTPAAATRTTATPAKQPITAPEPLAALVPREVMFAGRVPSDGGGDPPARDLFSSRSWAPPPPPAPPPPTAAAPVAPALPYTFVGKKLEQGSWEVYLARGEMTFLVREGQVLEAAYRIDKIAPPAMTLTYLPLGQAQSLPIGDDR